VTPHHSLGDIIANSVTHGVGAALSIAGVAVLITSAATHGSPVQIVSCAVYGSTLALVYLCSTLYHSLVRTRARRVFQILDHSAIYLLIAGTYTPFMLVSLHGKVGWTLFGIIWALAIAGIVFKSLALGRFAAASAIVYIFMGWLVVVAMRPLVQAVGWHAILWLGSGGALYTGGIVFFALDHRRYFHALWHLFVLGGSVLHYFAILFYIIPSRA
jgi:hemolysin III